MLDAICEFTLESEVINPQARLANLGSTSQIELIRDITSSILDREQKKLVAQFIEQHPDVPEDVTSGLYCPEEQRRRVASVLFGSPTPKPPVLSDSTLQTAYIDMVAQFAPQHPFLSGSSGAANLVFAGYVVVWALTQGDGADIADIADIARKAIRAKPWLVSSVLFELYVKWLSTDTARLLPLTDVGILYQALSSQVATGQRASLEITAEVDEKTLAVQFEILERADPSTGVATQGHTWGPFPSSTESILELRSPFSNVFIDAPIWVQLGDDINQQIGAPTEITAAQLTVSAKQILVHQASGDTVPERQTVSLVAEDADCSAVQNVVVKDAVLAVSWPGAKVHPWISYVAEAPVAPPDIDFMRRRLRRILTAFRSHSKGSLVRLAAKIDHSRMTKDTRGVALVNRLIDDNILRTFEAGKFYVLDPDRMGLLLGVDYQGLNQLRFTEKCDAYLGPVIN